MTALLQILAGLLALLGSGLALAAAVGTLRLPTFLARTHAASIAGSVGVGSILLAVALVAENGGVAVRALASVALLLLTTPIAAHLLARTSYRAGETGPVEDGEKAEGAPPEATK